MTQQHEAKHVHKLSTEENRVVDPDPYQDWIRIRIRIGSRSGTVFRIRIPDPDPRAIE
jgi:hypothetical protein